MSLTALDALNTGMRLNLVQLGEEAPQEDIDQIETFLTNFSLRFADVRTQDKVLVVLDLLSSAAARRAEWDRKLVDWFTVGYYLVFLSSCDVSTFAPSDPLYVLTSRMLDQFKDAIIRLGRSPKIANRNVQEIIAPNPPPIRGQKIRELIDYRRYEASKTQGNASMVVNMGDVYQGISNSTIVVRSKVEGAFNRLQDSGQSESVKLLVEIGNRVSDANNPAAGAVYNQMADEISKPAHDKGVIKSCWDGLVAILPPLATLSAEVIKAFVI